MRNRTKIFLLFLAFVVGCVSVKIIVGEDMELDQDNDKTGIDSDINNKDIKQDSTWQDR